MLGYTRAAKPKNNGSREWKFKQNPKNRRSSDCKLKLIYMKTESLVIINKRVMMNFKSNFAHTAHHTRRVVFFRNKERKLFIFIKVFIVRDNNYDSKDGDFFGGMRAGMAIWVKLTQGNGRGTCFWINYI